MINKAVGYSGFRTYGELPYPTRKQGKQLELANKVWQSTVRPNDHTNPLQNYHNNKTVYTKSYLENTFPQHYHPEHVPKGGNRTLQFQGTGLVKAYDREEALKYGTTQFREGVDDPRKARYLKTGTEHWRSVYQHSISDLKPEGFKGSSANGFRNISAADKNSNTGAGELQNAGQTQNQAGNQQGLTGIRSASVGGKTTAQINEEIGRQNSYKNRAYINNAKTGITDYKFNYGQKIGTSPFDLMNMVSIKQPLRDHPLKRGTNQMWTEIPNYQGFKPAELHFKEYQSKIENRCFHDKGNLKLQTAQNFLVQTPGYGGFKPQFQKITPNLRESCLSTK